MKNSLIFLILILVLLNSCCKEKIEVPGIKYKQLDSIKIESISYKIRNSYGDLNKDYITSFSYTDDKITEITNHINKYDLIFSYSSEKLLTKKFFDIEDEKIVAIDSFIYNQSGLLREKLRYNFDENGLKILRIKTKFYYNSASQIRKKVDFRMPDEEATFSKSYTWEEGNIKEVTISNNSWDITELYSYDQLNNFWCLNSADIDEPASKNNVLKMDLVDEIGIYEGLRSQENKIEYNEFDLPAKIFSTRITAFDVYNDTILINYIY